jgi:hypothetical protein
MTQNDATKREQDISGAWKIRAGGKLANSLNDRAPPNQGSAHFLVCLWLKKTSPVVPENSLFHEARNDDQAFRPELSRSL